MFHGAYFGHHAGKRAPPRRRAAGKVQAHRSRRPNGARLFRRHDAAPLHRPRHDARSRKCSSSTSPAPASIRRRACCCGRSFANTTQRQNDPAHHAQHGRGRRALPAHRHHRSWPDHRAGHSRRAEIFDSRRISAAPAFRPAADGLLSDCRALPGVTEVRPVETRRRYLRRSRRLADSEIVSQAAARGRRTVGRAHLRAQPGEPVPAPHRKEFARMNWKTFARHAGARCPRGAPQR